MSVQQTWIDVKTRTKKAYDDNPILFIGVGSALISSVAGLIKANTERKNSKTWRHEVDRRKKKDRDRRTA